MIPTPDTVDTIFGIVKALNEPQREDWKSRWKAAFWSLPAFFQIWLPAILLIMACGLGLLYKMGQLPMAHL